MEPEQCVVKKALEKKCEPVCVKAFKEYEECGKRVEAVGRGHCGFYYFDYLECIEKCVAPDLFKSMK